MEIQENKAIVNETNVDEVTMQEIKLSSGVGFTQEELTNTDPAVRAKLEKVKIADANFTRGFNEKVLEVEKLKAELEKLKSGIGTEAKTPAPKADEVDEVVSPRISPTDLYVYGKMTEEAFNKSKIRAEAKYGVELTALMHKVISPAIDLKVASGEYTTDFDSMWVTTYAEQSLTNPEFKSAIIKQLSFEDGKSKEEIEAEAKAKAAKEILEIKDSTTTGLPSGGTKIVQPPLNENVGGGLKRAHELRKAFINSLKENIK